MFCRLFSKICAKSQPSRGKTGIKNTPRKRAYFTLHTILLRRRLTDSPVSATGSPLQYAPLGHRRCLSGPQWYGPLSESGRNCGRWVPICRRRFPSTCCKMHPICRTVPPAGDSWKRYRKHRTVLSVSAESYGQGFWLHSTQRTRVTILWKAP